MLPPEVHIEKNMYTKCEVCKHIAQNKLCEYGDEENHTCRWSHTTDDAKVAKTAYAEWIQVIIDRRDAQIAARREPSPELDGWPNAKGALKGAIRGKGEPSLLAESDPIPLAQSKQLSITHK